MIVRPWPWRRTASSFQTMSRYIESPASVAAAPPRMRPVSSRSATLNFCDPPTPVARLLNAFMPSSSASKVSRLSSIANVTAMRRSSFELPGPKTLACQVTLARVARHRWPPLHCHCIAADMGRLALAIVILLCGAGAAAAQIDSAPKVHARLVAETGEVAPGSKITIALEEIIRTGWHTYWINPGEAGLPTEIHWKLPPNWQAGPIQWPYPKRLPVGTLMNYGYENKVWLMTDVTAPRNAKPGVVQLKAHANWLVCKEVCIPEEADVSLPMTINAAPSKPYATIEDQFAAAREKLPSFSPWRVTFHTGANLDVFIASPALAKAQLKSAVFFPLAGRTITDFAPQRFATAAHGLVLQLKPA